MIEHFDIWILRRRRRVVVTDLPGPPCDLIVASNGTLGGTYFDGECWIAFVGLREDAIRVGKIAAEIRGFQLDVELHEFLELPDEDVEGAEEWMDEQDDEDLVEDEAEELT